MDELKENEVKTSVGVVFKTKPVPPVVFDFLEQEAKVSKPKVPSVLNESKGFDEPNPTDPDYVEAYANWEKKGSDRVLNTLYKLGLEIVEIPDGLPKVEDEEWTKDLIELGMEIPTDEKERKLLWMKSVAAPSLGDMQMLSIAVYRITGVAEEDVASAVSTFRH